MELHDELIVHARALVSKPVTTDADARRAVSAAYYAVFHLLTFDGASLFEASAFSSLKLLFRRAYTHRPMKDCSSQFVGGTVKEKALRAIGLKHYTLPDWLKLFARTFVQLQEERHDADYNYSYVTNASEAGFVIDKAETAINNWKAARATPEAALYLLSMMMYYSLDGR